MPLISSKGMYGLSAMHELSKGKKDNPMQIREISANADIPQNYLEQLLSKLRKAALVNSVRGSKGGYFLSRDPKDIKVFDILIALEDDLKICDSKTANPILDLFFGETSLHPYIISRRRAMAPTWPIDDTQTIIEHKHLHDQGRVIMCQGRDGEFIIQYAIPTQRRRKCQPYFYGG